MTDRVRMTERDVCGVVSAEARAANRDAVSTAFAPREVEHVANNDVLKRVVVRILSAG